MVTILRVDANLIAEAVRIGGHRSRKAAVTHALTEYIERRKQGAIIDLFGKIDAAGRRDETPTQRSDRVQAPCADGLNGARW